MMNLQTRKQRAEELIGKPVSTVSLDLQRMLERGLLITLHVYGAGLFQRTLRLEELAIDSHQATRTDSARGSIDPALNKRLKAWATRCRQAVDKFCVRLDSVDKLTRSRGWRLLLYESYDDFVAWMERLDSIRQRIVADALERYDEIVAENQAYYRNLANENWIALRARYPSGFALNVKGHTFGPDDRAAYVAWVIDAGMEAIPTRDRIRNDIRCTWSTSLLFSDADLAEENARAARAAAEEAAARRVLLQERQLDLEVREREMAQRAREAAIRAAEIERARAELDAAVSPLQEIVNGVYAELARSTRKLLAGYEKHGAFRGRALDMARNITDLWRYMGGEFVGDDELRALVERLRAATSSENVNATTVVENLQAIQAIVTVDAPRHIARRSRGGTLEL